MPWSVYADGAGRWHWQMLDARAGELAHCARAFATRDECLSDARKHGYTGEHQGPGDDGSNGEESR